MSRSVDNRIVNMNFNNAQFESGVKNTMSSLDRLKSSLNFDDSSKGMDKLKVSFSALDIVAGTVISNITSSVMSLAGNIINHVVSPLTKAFDQVITGGTQRAKNLEQAKFMFQGLGMDIDEAMKNSLDAVKGTAYGLDAAAKTASQLGASGIKLGKDMTSALRGIAGTAAMTNSSYEDIADIFTTVAGNGRLMTIELRRLSSRGLNVAAVLGKEFGKTEAEIRELVTKGKISFEMFADAMSNSFGKQATKANETFSGSLANTKAALSRIGATVATPTLTQLRNVFNALTPVVDDFNVELEPIVEMINNLIKASSKFAIKFLKNVDLTAPVAIFRRFLEVLGNVGKSIGSVIKPITRALASMFPENSEIELWVFMNNLSELSKKLQISGETSAKLERIFKGVFAAVDILIMVFQGLYTIVSTIAPAFKPVLNVFLEILATIGDFVKALRDFLRGADVLTDLKVNMMAAADGIAFAIDKIKDYFSKFGNIDISPMKIFSKEAEESFKPFTAIANMFKKAWDVIVKVWKFVEPVVVPIAKAVGDVMKQLPGAFMEFLRSGDLQELAKVFTTGALGVMLLRFGEFIKSLSGFGKKSKGILDSIKGILDEIRNALVTWQNNLKANILLKIAAAIGILAVSLLVLSLIPKDKLVGALAAVTTLFIDLFASMAIFSKIMKADGFKSMTKMALGMIGVSIAVLILTKAVRELAGFSWEELAKGLLSISVLLAGLGLFVKMVGDKKLISVGVGLAALSLGILALSNAVRAFGEMDIPTLIQGIIGLGFVLALLSGFLNATMDAKKVISTSVGLTILSVAMLLLSKVLQSFGEMPLETLGKGLLGMAAAFIVIAGALKLLPKKIEKQSLGLLLISFALGKLKNVLEKFSSMTAGEIAKSLIVLASSLAIISVAMKAMSGTLSGAAALLVVSAALALLAPVLLLFGNMDLETIGKSLLMIAGIFTIFGLAAIILGPVIPLMVGLAGAIALLGVGLLGIGAGLALLSVGLVTLAGAFAAHGAVIFQIIKSLLNLIPYLAKKIGEGIVEFVKALGTGAKAIFEAITKLLLGILQTIIDVTPKFFEMVTKLLLGILQLVIDTAPKAAEAMFVVLTALLEELTKFIPKVANAALEMVTGILQALADNMPKIVKQGTRVVTEFIRGIGKAIPELVDAGFKMIIDLVNGLADALRENAKPMGEAFRNLASAAMDAFFAFFGLGDVWQKVKDIGKQIIDGLVGGIKAAMGAIGDAAEWVTDSLIGGVKDLLGIHSPSRVFKIIGMQIGKGMAIGIRKSANDVLKSSTSMAKQIVKNAKGTVESWEKFVENKKYYNQMSLKQELAGWLLMQKKYDKLSVGNAKKLASIKKQIAAIEKQSSKASKKTSEKGSTETFTSTTTGKKYTTTGTSKKASQEERKRDNKTTNSKLNNLKKLQKKYEEVAAGKKKADREVYRLYMELEKKKHDDTMQKIDDRKYYNNLTLSQELNLLKKLQKQQKKGTDLRKKTDREVYRVQQEIKQAQLEYNEEIQRIEQETAQARIDLEEDHAQKVKDVNEQLAADIQGLNDAYEEAIKSRTEALYDYYGLFDKVERKRKVSSARLTKNLEDQVKSMQNYIDQLNTLSARGIDEELMKELREMGQGAEKEIEALNGMSEEELTRYVDLWRQKSQLAKDQAMNEMSGMKTETENQIKELQLAAQVELGALNATFQVQMQQLNNQAKADLDALNKQFKASVGSLSKTTVKQFKDLNISLKSTFKVSEWNKISKNVMDGLKKGVINESPDVIKRFEQMATDALNAVKKKLGIKSPSLAFAEVGKFADLGVVKGVEAYSHKVNAATETVGLDSVESLKDAMSAIEDVVNYDVDPTIRPVLDLTDVSAGMASMDRKLEARRSIELGASIRSSQNGSEYESMLEKFVTKLQTSNGDITNAIESLKEDFGDLIETFESMGVVLDSGHLIGALAPGVDRALGRTSSLNRRGVTP